MKNNKEIVYKDNKTSTKIYKDSRVKTNNNYYLTSGNNSIEETYNSSGTKTKKRRAITIQPMVQWRRVLKATPTKEQRLIMKEASKVNFLFLVLCRVII